MGLPADGLFYQKKEKEWGQINWAKWGQSYPYEGPGTNGLENQVGAFAPTGPNVDSPLSGVKFVFAENGFLCAPTLNLRGCVTGLV